MQFGAYFGLNIFFVVLIAWFCLLLYCGLIILFGPENDLMEDDQLQQCITSLFIPPSCQSTGTLACGIVSASLIVYAIIGVSYFISLMAMLGALYFIFWTKGVSPPRHQDHLWRDELKACMFCQFNGTCVINSSRKCVTCCSCPFLFVFFIVSGQVFSHMTFDSYSPTVLNDVGDYCLVTSDVTSTLNSSEPVVLIVPPTLKVSFVSIVIQWAIILAFALWGCGLRFAENRSKYRRFKSIAESEKHVFWMDSAAYSEVGSPIGQAKARI